MGTYAVPDPSLIQVMQVVMAGYGGNGGKVIIDLELRFFHCGKWKSNMLDYILLPYSFKHRDCAPLALSTSITLIVRYLLALI